MRETVARAFCAEIDKARSAYEAGAYAEAFAFTERAHILGQRFFIAHLQTHVWMLRIGVRRHDAREIVGQVVRLFAVIPGYLVGWIPRGNTGGANVSALKPMPVPDDLKAILGNETVTGDVMKRVLLWSGVAIAGCITAVALA